MKTVLFVMAVVSSTYAMASGPTSISKKVDLSNANCRLETSYTHGWKFDDGILCYPSEADLTNVSEIKSGDAEGYKVEPVEANGVLALKISFTNDRTLREHLVTFSKGGFSAIVSQQNIQPVNPGSTNQE